MELNIFYDCWQLVKRFCNAADEAQHAEFELFCECWREMNFQSLFLAQTNHVELIQTTLAALHVAKRLSCGRRSNGEVFNCTRAQRIAGFYLLYVIYNKQPMSGLVKIEVSQKTWDMIISYVESLRAKDPDKRETQQVSYMLWKLVQQQAFRFTGMDYHQSLGDLVDYDQLQVSLNNTRGKMSKSMVADQFVRSTAEKLADDLVLLQHMDSICGTLSQAEEIYNKQKAEHRLSETNIFSKLENVFKNILGTKNDDEIEADADVPSSSNQTSAQSIRMRALYGDIKAQKSVEAAQTSTVQPAATRASYLRRSSSYTVFSEKLVKDLADELLYDEDGNNKFENNDT